MADLYAIANGAAVSLGALRGIAGSARLNEAEIVAATLDSFKRAVTVPGFSGLDLVANPVPDSIKGLAGKLSKFAIGWTDGTAAPTVAADDFVFPSTRSFLRVTGSFIDLAERLTEDGKRHVISLHTQSDLPTWIETGDSGPDLNITLKKKA